MFKIGLLCSKVDYLIEPFNDFFKNKDVQLICISNDEHSDFLKKAQVLNIENKYLTNGEKF